MTTFANLTLNDGKATPVSHTFGTVNIDGYGMAKWVDRSGGIAIGFPRITFWMKEPAKGARSYKMVARCVLPVLEVTSPSTTTGIQPAPTLAYNITFDCSATLPERSSLAERKDAFAIFKNFLATNVLTNAVENYEPIAG